MAGRETHRKPGDAGQDWNVGQAGQNACASLHSRNDAGSDGGAEGNRTPDLLNAIQALSQLSYGPVALGGTL